MLYRRWRCRSGAPTTSTGVNSADAATTVANRALDGVEQTVLQEDVLDGVSRQRQLGKHRKRDTVVVAVARHPQHGFARWPRGRPTWCGACMRRPGRSRADRQNGRPRLDCLRPPTLDTVEAPELINVLAGQRVAVLTGAGLSTDSGIPDYRGPDSPPSNPMTIGQFTSDAVFRQRYWARNHVGWRHMDATLPNAGHRALATLERAGVVTGVITQNVDLLHTKAGSQTVIDLHGRTRGWRACSAGTRSPGPRWPISWRRSTRASPSGRRRSGASRSRPTRTPGDRDGVVPLRGLPAAAACSSPNRVLRRERAQGACGAGLFARRRRGRTAGRRIVADGVLRPAIRPPRRAKGKPVAIVNRGPTRGDALASVKVDGGCSELLGGSPTSSPLRFRRANRRVAHENAPKSLVVCRGFR